MTSDDAWTTSSPLISNSHVTSCSLSARVEVRAAISIGQRWFNVSTLDMMDMTYRSVLHGYRGKGLVRKSLLIEDGGKCLKIEVVKSKLRFQL